MSLAYPTTRSFAWRPALVAAGLVVAAMALGQVATMPNLAWYHSLQKPWFTPPDWVFGPVWTVLYVMMGYLFWRIARLPAYVNGRRAALAAFIGLLVVNVVWSYAFFAAHSPTLGLVDIAAQVVALAVTAALFSRVDGYEAVGFLPVALWVAYAGALNFEIWRMN